MDCCKCHSRAKPSSPRAKIRHFYELTRRNGRGRGTRSRDRESDRETNQPALAFCMPFQCPFLNSTHSSCQRHFPLSDCNSMWLESYHPVATPLESIPLFPLPSLPFASLRQFQECTLPRCILRLIHRNQHLFSTVMQMHIYHHLHQRQTRQLVL